MKLLISNAILHTVGYDDEDVRFSDVELEVDSETCHEFIGKHIRRLLRNPAAREAAFTAESQAYGLIKSFMGDEIGFKELSRKLCERLAEVIRGNEDIPPADVLFTFFDYGKKTYIAIIKLNYGECFTRRLTAGEDGQTDNQIVKNSIVLPISAGNVEEACLIPYEPMILRVLEKPHKIGGAKACYFSELFLECETQLSQREAADILQEIADEVIAKYYNGNVEMSARVKTAFIQSAEEMDEDNSLLLDSVMDPAFGGNGQAKDEFMALAREYTLPHRITLDKSFVRRAFKTQRFKAENGVELSFPAELCQDPERIQMLENEDGSVTITLKKLYPAY